jgi:hypothetical protein
VKSTWANETNGDVNIFHFFSQGDRGTFVWLKVAFCGITSRTFESNFSRVYLLFWERLSKLGKLNSTEEESEQKL